jgi:hypothetical protein
VFDLIFDLAVHEQRVVVAVVVVAVAAAASAPVVGEVRRFAVGTGQHCGCWFGLVIALHLQTPKHIRGGWSRYTDTSEPVDSNGAQNMVSVQCGFEPATFRSLPHELANCSNRAHDCGCWMRTGKDNGCCQVTVSNDEDDDGSDDDQVTFCQYCRVKTSTGCCQVTVCNDEDDDGSDDDQVTFCQYCRVKTSTGCCQVTVCNDEDDSNDDDQVTFCQYIADEASTVFVSPHVQLSQIHSHHRLPLEVYFVVSIQKPFYRTPKYYDVVVQLHSMSFNKFSRHRKACSVSSPLLESCADIKVFYNYLSKEDRI